MAKKPGSSPSRPTLWLALGWLLQPGQRWATLSVVAVAAMLAGWWALWRHVRPRVLADDAYRVELDDVALSPPPAWIRRDVRREALERGGLDFPLDLLDPAMLARVASAFEAHPWIARVAEVRKRHPARIEVTVDYRRPVAMIEVQGGLYPVDELGTLLPSDDFTPETAARYPRVGGFETAPLGPPGSSWGDPRVAAAARLGDLLAENWTAWRLSRITPVELGTPDATSLEFQIATAGGAVVVWGHVPEAEIGREPRAEEKLARLRALAGRPHGIDGDVPEVIDLRRAAPEAESSHTADRDPDSPRRS